MVRFLFSQDRIFDLVTRREREALEAVEAVPAERLVRDPIEEVVAELAATYQIDEPRLTGDRYLAEGVKETKLDRRAPMGMSWMDALGPVPGQRIEVRQAFEGPPALLDCCPSNHGLNFPQGDVEGQEVIVVLERATTSINPEQVKGEIEASFSHIERLMENLRRDVEGFNRALPGKLRTAVEQRKTRIQKGVELEAYLGFPIVKRGDPSPALAVEVPRRRAAAVERSQRPASQQREEQFLTADAFAEIVGLLGTLRRLIERLPETFSQFGEEGLRDVLLLILNNQFGPAAGESFSRAGKTDIFIQTPQGPVFIAECKIWEGKKRFSEGVDQLLGYLTWRDTKAAMIAFVREEGVTEIGVKALETLREHGLFVKDADPIEGDPVVILHHQGDEQRQLRMALIVVAMPAIGRASSAIATQRSPSRPSGSRGRRG